MNYIFACEYCHEAVDARDTPPVCGNCGTIFRLKEDGTGCTIIKSQAGRIDGLALIIVVCGGIGFVWKREPRWLMWFCLFAGYALQYWNGIRCGVLRSCLLIFRSSVTCYRTESDTLYGLAVIVEGMIVLALFIAFLCTLF
jgi:hypothetical protein